MNQVLRILNARKRLALSLLLLVFVADAATTLMLPKKYSAIATVVSDPKAPDPVYGYTVSNYGAATNLATQVDIITSDRVGLRVVRLLGLDKDPDARLHWQEDGRGKGTVEEYFADLLTQHLDVKPSRESDVISIKYTAPSPEFAAQVVNAFAKAYVDVSLELRTDPARASSEFFNARTRQLRVDLESAQARLSDFQRSHTVTDERLDVETSRLNELSSQLTAIQALHAESQSRENQAFGKASTSPDVMQNPVIQQLRIDLGRAEAKVQELKNQLGPNHPQLQTAQAEVESLKSRMQSEMHQIAGSVGTANTVNLERETKIKAAFEEQKQRVLELRAQRDQAGVLQKDLEEAQKAYDLVAQRRSQTNLESLNQQANVAILSEAQLPTEPSQPRVLLNLLVGVFVGTLLGIGAALAMELVDRRVRGKEGARQVYGLPILVSLPLARKRIPVAREWSFLRSRLGSLLRLRSNVTRLARARSPVAK
jgi:chain length determinant protein EpsF